MSANELIKMLQKKIKKYGDCVIHIPSLEFVDESDECLDIEFCPADSGHNETSGINWNIPNYFYLK